MTCSAKRCMCAVLLAVTLAVIVRRADAASPAPNGISAQVESALMAGDWRKVAVGLPAGDLLSASPVARLLKGHACLAINRNNESIEAFASASKDSDVADWDAWTSVLAVSRGDNAVVHYLRGDAYARLRKWDDAVASFTRALLLNPDFALALDARGAVYAMMGKHAQAIVDFHAAAGKDPGLADAYASRGAFCIQAGEGAKGALNAFDRALKVSPDSLQAAVGRACALFACGRWEQAEAILGKLTDDPVLGVVARADLGTIRVARLDLLQTQLAASEDGALPPGTTVDASVRDLAGSIAAKLPSLSSNEIQPYHNALVKENGIGPVSRAFDIAKNQIARDTFSTFEQAKTNYSHFARGKGISAYANGFGNTAETAGAIAKAAGLFLPDPRLKTAANIADMGGKGLKVAGAFADRNAMSALAKGDKCFEQISRTNMNLNAFRDQLDTLNGPRTYSMPLTGQMGQDKTIASVMAGQVPRTADKIYIVSPNADLGKSIQQNLVTKGFSPSQIVMNRMDPSAIASNLGSNDYVLKAGNFGPKGVTAAPGGVTTDLEKAFVDKGGRRLMVPYGLLYPMDPSVSFARGKEDTNASSK